MPRPPLPKVKRTYQGEYGLVVEFEDETIQPYDSDHTALVHVLWAIKREGLTLDDFDEVASKIMQSSWMKAVRLHAIEAHARSLDPEQFKC